MPPGRPAHRVPGRRSPSLAPPPASLGPAQPLHAPPGHRSSETGSLPGGTDGLRTPWTPLWRDIGPRELLATIPTTELLQMTTGRRKPRGPSCHHRGVCTRVCPCGPGSARSSPTDAWPSSGLGPAAGGRDQIWGFPQRTRMCSLLSLHDWSSMS